VTGDLNLERARKLVEKHFGDVPDRPAPVRPSFAEPPPDGERRAEHIDTHAPLPALAVGYRLPDPIGDIDGYVAHVVLAGVLADGDGSRLKQRLVHREPLVTDVNAGCGLFGPFEARDPDTFTITAMHSPSVSEDTLLGAIDEELEKVAAGGPSEEELAKVTVRWVASLHREHDRMVPRTLALGSFELLHGDPALVYELPERISAVTQDAVAAVATELRPNSRAVLTVRAGAGGDA
jgi:predicted Zn-dependent peptidase